MKSLPESVWSLLYLFLRNLDLLMAELPHLYGKFRNITTIIIITMVVLVYADMRELFILSSSGVLNSIMGKHQILMLVSQVEDL